MPNALARKQIASNQLLGAVGLGLPCYFRCANRQSHDAGAIPLTSRMVSAFVWILYFIYPSTIIMLFKVFHCTEPIDGVRYLWSDLATECYGGEHLGTAWIAGVLLVVCNAAMPSAVAYLTWTNRHKLDDPIYKTKYGFLKKHDF